MRPEEGALALCPLRVELFLHGLACVVVFAIGVLGLFVCAAGAVGGDDGGKGTGGDGEEDFEGEREVAD